MCYRCALDALWAQQCLHSVHGGLCGEPAVVHIQIGGNELEGETLTCEEHRICPIHLMGSHEIGTSCGLPDAVWVDDGDGRSHCEMEDFDAKLAELNG